VKRGVATLLVLLAAGCSGTDERVIVAAGTTVVDSGFIERVLEEYPSDVQVSVVGVSSREALALGAAGSAELLITHLPEAETAFLTAHPGASQVPVFSSEFVLVGPSGEMSPDVVEAFRTIAAEEHPFVSRGDGSGTAAKEREIWESAGIDPTHQPWYVVTGQGMGFTLQVADQRRAFTLAEVGTLLGAVPLTLIPVSDGDRRLENPYRVTLVEGASPAARALFDWLTSEAGTDAIIDANVELFGELLYAPTSP
jgi:tungstate transport system substrate-binding protein